MTAVTDDPFAPPARTGAKQAAPPPNPRKPPKTIRGRRPSSDRPSRKPRPPRKPIAPPSPTATAIGLSCAALTALLTWFVFYALVLSSFEYGHDQAVLYSQLREELAGATAPVGGKIKPDAPVALLSLPSVGIRNQVVVEGTAAGDLMRGPGHKRDTVLPGQVGTSVIYGRATLFGGPFGSLADAKSGDIITVTTGQGSAKYTVEDVRRAGDSFPAPLRSGGGRLILTTAEGGSWRAGWAPNSVVYVDAILQGTAFPTSGGRVGDVATSETALQGDPGALFVLILWLPLLAAGVGFGVWAQVVWGKWQAWVVGVPIILAGLWGVSQAAIQLLPNLT